MLVRHRVPAATTATTLWSSHRLATAVASSGGSCMEVSFPEQIECQLIEKRGQWGQLCSRVEHHAVVLAAAVTAVAVGAGEAEAEQQLERPNRARMLLLLLRLLLLP
eukprot:COSAG05_NODE_715_length_7805_cov_5.098235_8_plen_107_part_00